MAQTKRPLIIYFERQRLYLIGSSLQKETIWDIPQDLLSDLEVLKPTDFENFIKARLLEAKIEPVQAAFILSEAVYFEKDIPPEQSQLAHDFLDNVPFEHLATATFTLEKSTRIIATNQELLGSIQSAFSAAGFMIIAIVPSFLLTQFGVDLKQGFDSQKVGGLFSHFEALKAYSLFPQQEIIPQQGNTVSQTPKKSGSNRVILLVGIFAVLIAILIALIVVQGNQNTPPLRPASKIIKNTP